jgi:nucleotide-binding universal stress UspA family protein
VILEMDPFKSILVDIDAAVPAHPALERAIRLARASGATVTITDVMTVPAYARRYLPADVEEEMVTRRRQQLARRKSFVRSTICSCGHMRGT